MIPVFPFFKRGIPATFVLVFMANFLWSCSTVEPISPPSFDYDQLADTYLDNRAGGHLPMTSMVGSTMHPTIAENRYLFYTSSAEGSLDIWLRDLESTVNIPLVRHPSEQYSPAVTQSGDRIVFISEDLDSTGDIYIIPLKGGPSPAIRRTLLGAVPMNFWEIATNLSDKIKAFTSDMGPACQYASSERNPVWSPDGNTLYFVSDRCTPGKMNLWSVAMDGTRIAGIPKKLTELGAEQPSIDRSGTQIAYVSYRTRGSKGEIYIMDLKSGMERRILPSCPANRCAVLHPSLSSDGKTLFFASIQEDSDHNGVINLSDNAGIFRINLDPENAEEEMILESANPIYDVVSSDFIQGSVFYSAGIGRNSGIYMIRDRGAIPEKKSIQSQYELTEVFRKKAPDRYVLSLEAVKNYFGHSPLYPLYEGDILADRIQFNAKDPRQEAKLRAANPFASMILDLRLNEKFARDPVSTIQSRMSIFESLQNSTKQSERMYYPASLERLAVAQKEHGKHDDALKTILTLTRNFPDYFRNDEARMVEGELLLEKKGTIPQPFTRLYSSTESTVTKENIIKRIIDHFSFQYRRYKKTDDLNRELTRSDLPRAFKNALLFVKASEEYDRGNYTQSLELAGQSLDGEESGTGNFIRGHRLRAEIFSRINQPTRSFDERLVYGGAYRPESGVTMDPDEFREILEESEMQIREHLRAAESMARAVDNWYITRSSMATELAENLFTLIQLKEIEEPVLQLDSATRDIMILFCRPEGQAADLLRRSGQPKYVKEQLQICTTYNDYFQGNNQKGISPVDARSAADLLYLTGYIHANLLNVLFLQIKRVGQFEELYRDLSVHFHRLKVDIAMERNRKRLSWQKQDQLLLDPTQLGDFIGAGDPFDATAFNELLHGYQMASNEARRYGDLSLLYGYAYTLIQKSVERESFYEQLFSENTALPYYQLKNKKIAFLRDLKKAEYELQYILHTDPDNTDAILLLGWMHEYIDERRSRPALRRMNLVSRIVDSLLGTNETQKSDGRYFQKFYDVFFPEQLFESNIDLYSRALDRQNPDSVEAAHLHLNIANNYFKLMNFKSAVDHYREVDRLLRIHPDSLFESYEPAAIFRFNFGRALFYETRNLEANGQLQIAEQIYIQNEYLPLQRELDTLRFKLNAYAETDKRNPDRLMAEALVSGHQDRITTLRRKLAIIASLRGLALQEAGMFESANVALGQADTYQYGFQQKPGNPIPRDSLLNYMAISDQGTGKLDLSTKRAGLAARMTGTGGLYRNDEKYMPETIGGRCLGCMMGMGEDFSVIGPGRNPYGFSPLRRYELSLGIQLENSIRKGDTLETFALLQKRREVFASKDGDVYMGRTGEVNSINSQALNHYRIGNNLYASELFQDAALKAREAGDLQLYRSNMENYFHALLAFFENARFDSLSSMNLVFAALEETTTFRQGYRDRAKLAYEARRRTETPSFVYEPERDDPILDDLVQKDLSEITLIEGHFHYYRALLLDRMAKDATGVQEAHSGYLVSSRIYNSIIPYFRNAPGEENAKTLRIRLNKSRSLHSAGDLMGAREELYLILELSREYRLTDIEWTSLYYLSQVQFEIHEKLDPSQDDGRSSYEAAMDIFDSRPDIHKSVSFLIDDFFNYVAYRYSNQKMDQKIPQILEKKWSSFLFREFFRFPIAFKNMEIQTAVADFRMSMDRLKTLSSRESEILTKHGDASRYTEEKNETLKKLIQKKEKILSLQPELLPFLQYPNPSLTGIRRQLPGNLTLQTALIGDTVHLWSYWKGKTFHKKMKVQGGTNQTLGQLLENPVDATDKSPRSIFILPDQDTYFFPYYSTLHRIYPDSPSPVYITRLGDSVPGFNQTAENPERFNLYNLTRQGVYNLQNNRDPDFDVLDVGTLSWTSIHGMGNTETFRPTRWIEKEHFASIIQMDIDKKDPSPFLTAALTYEYMQVSGTGSLLVHDRPQEKDQITEVYDNLYNLIDKQVEFRPVDPANPTRGYGNEKIRVFGYQGFIPSENRDNLYRAYNRSLERGKRKESNKEYLAANKEYLLASSYLKILKDTNGDEIPAKAGLARTRILTGEMDQGLEGYKTIIEELKGENKLPELREIYRDSIEVLYTMGHTEEAESFVHDQLNDLPPRYQVDPVRISYLRMKSFLHNTIVRNSEDRVTFANRFNKAFSSFASDRDRVHIIRDLVKHGRYREASRLARTLPGNFGADLVNADRNLIENEHVVTVPQMAQTDVDYPYSILGIVNNENQFEEIKSTIRFRYRPEAADLKERIYESWKTLINTGHAEISGLLETKHPDWNNITDEDERNMLEGLMDNIQDTGRMLLLMKKNIKIPTIGSYALILPQERVILYRLFIEAIPYDTGLQTARYLEHLIDREAELTSPARASRMALFAAKAYLNYDDPETARLFYSIYKKHSGSNIPDLDLEQIASGVHIFLELYQTSPEEESTLDLADQSIHQIYKIFDTKAKPVEEINLNAADPALLEIYRKFQKDENIHTTFKRISPTLQKNPNPVRLKAIRAMAEGMKREACESGEATLALNLSFYLQNLRLFESSLKEGMPSHPLPVFENITDRLQKRLPVGQRIVALVDAPEKACRVMITEGKTYADVLSISGRELRGRTRRDLFREANEEPSVILTDAIRSLVGISDTRTTYLWLPGIYSYAPLIPRSGDRIFQFTNPVALLENRIVRSPLNAVVRVESMGNRSTREPWSKRLLDMELSVLPGEGEGKPALHILESVSDRNVVSFVHRYETGMQRYRFWFISDNEMAERDPEGKDRAGWFLWKLGSLPGLGVLALQKTENPASVVFIREFYGMKGSENLQSRFSIALDRSARKTDYGPVRFGFRAITGQFIDEEGEDRK